LINRFRKFALLITGYLLLLAKKNLT